MRPGRAQQIDGLLQRRAKLAREIVDRSTLRQGEPHKKAQSRRVADQPDRYGLLQDLGQLVGAVEREVGHAVAVKASRIAGRLLTGCMKWISAAGKSLRTSPTSG